MSIGTVGNISQRSVVNCTAEKESEKSVGLFRNCYIPYSRHGFSKAFAAFLKKDKEETKDPIGYYIWSFLTQKEIVNSSFVSKFWKEVASSNLLWASLHGRTFFSENKVPAPLKLTAEESLRSSGICKERYLETNAVFPNKIGAEFYSEYLGDVKTIPIPEAFIKRAKEVDPFDPEGRLVKDTHRLVYVPKEITITVPAGSNLTLNEKGRLVEALEVVNWRERTLRVPVTINNLSMLTGKCLKKGYETEICEYSWEPILDGPGDELVEEAYWSYQRKDVVGGGASYEDQTILARANGYEVPSLRDRVVLNMLTYVESGAFVDRLNVARTSTSVVGGGVYQADSGAFGLRLSLCYYSLDYRRVGVALEVPSGSSETLDTCN